MQCLWSKCGKLHLMMVLPRLLLQPTHTELKLRIWFGNYMEKIRPVLKLLWSLDVRNMDLYFLKISNLVSWWKNSQNSAKLPCLKWLKFIKIHELSIGQLFKYTLLQKKSWEKNFILQPERCLFFWNHWEFRDIVYLILKV